LIERSILNKYADLTPAVVRKIELLESLMFGFLGHVNDLAMLDEMEKIIFDGAFEPGRLTH